MANMRIMMIIEIEQKDRQPAPVLRAMLSSLCVVKQGIEREVRELWVEHT